MCGPSFAFLASVVSPGCIFISDDLGLRSTDERDIAFVFVYTYAYTYILNVVLLGLPIMSHHQPDLNSSQEKNLFFLFFSCFRRASKRLPKQHRLLLFPLLASQRLKVSPHCWRCDALQTQALRKWATSDPQLPLPEDQLSAQKGAMQAATWGRGKQSSYSARMPTGCNDGQHHMITLTLTVTKRY